MGRVKRRRKSTSTSIPVVLETALEVLVIFLLAFTPLAFGTVHPWSKFIFVSVTLALGLIGLVLFRINREAQERPTPAIAPEFMLGLGFLVLLIIQTVPLPKSLVTVLSPGTVSVMETWLAPGAVPDWITLSLYPLNTRLDLAIVTSLCMFFWVITTHFGSSDKIRRILLVAAFIGAILGFIALLHQLLGLTKIFGIIKVAGSNANGGVFVNSNNFGQFALLALGLTVGAGVYQYKRVKSLVRSLKKQPSDDTLIKLREQRILLIILCVGGLILIAAIAGSTSRASFVGLVLGALLCGIFLVRRVTDPIVLGAWALGLVVVVFVLSLTSIETIFDQIEDVDSAFYAFSHRVFVAKDLINEWWQFPIFGAGQGTHSIVYPAFQSFQSDKIIDYGDLDYFQFLAENGVVGVALLLAFFVTVFWRAIKTITAHRHRLQIAAVGLSSGLLGVGIVSMSDFGQRFPGVSIYTVLTVALIVNLYRIRPEDEDSDSSEVSKNQKAVALPGSDRWMKPRAAVAAFLIVLSVWGVWNYTCNWLASRWGRLYTIADKTLRQYLPESQDLYIARINYAKNAVWWEPSNVVHASNLANARWLTLCYMNTLDEGVLTREPQLSNMARIHDEANATRLLGPSYARLPSIMGYIDAIRGKKEQAIAFAELSVKLSHSDPSILFDAGIVSNVFGQEKRATELFSDALICSSGKFQGDIRRYLIDKCQRPDLFLESVPDKMVVLVSVYQELSANPLQYRLLMGPIRSRAIMTLEQAIKDTPKLMVPNRYALLAGLYAQDDQPEKALEILDAHPTGLAMNVTERLKIIQYIRLGRLNDALKVAMRSDSKSRISLTDAVNELIALQANSGYSPALPVDTQPAQTQPATTAPTK